MNINIFRRLIKKYREWQNFRTGKKRVWAALNTPEAYQQFKMLQHAFWGLTLGWKERAARDGFKERNYGKDASNAPGGEKNDK